MSVPHNDADQPEVDFGFRRVGRAEKAGMVRDVFDNVAENYDLMNDLMSGGVHRLWKSTLLDRLNPRPGMTLLDVAGGTGDVAKGFLKRARDGADRPSSKNKAAAQAVVCDVNHAMLHAGARQDEKKGWAANYEPGALTRVTGDAECLPIPDQSVDAYVIAFGIRNVTDLDAALRDAHRVLRHGGRFFCLEFSHPITEGFQKVYDAYSMNVIPFLGEKVANDRASYQYLVESIRRFPAQEAFAIRIKNAGFSRVKYENLTGGVAALHCGWRL